MSTSLKIGADQSAKLNRLAAERYRRRLIEFLEMEYPEGMKALGAGKHAFIERCISSAWRHGLSSEAGTAVYAELSLSYGESFVQTSEWAKYILHESDLEPEEKVARLLEYTFRATEQQDANVSSEESPAS